MVLGGAGWCLHLKDGHTTLRLRPDRRWPLAHQVAAASKAFFWVMGGLQINYSSKLNVFAHYLLTSSAANFLLQSNTHTLQGGIRLSLGTSKEGITEQH